MDVLCISGQFAMDRSGPVLGLVDARVKARQCYEILAAILAHYGGRLRELLKTTTCITHCGYRPLVAAARDERFPAPSYPANTLVVVQGLAEPYLLVEVQRIAVVDRLAGQRRGRAPAARVQRR
jgi:enamine deaminase RidA (YjgF/YER057c/UK114 family)